MGRTYSRISDPQLSDLPLIWDSSNSDWRLCTLQDIMTLFEANMTETGVQEAQTQYAAPTTAGFDIQINDNDDDTHLILTPTNTLANGAITLPYTTNVRDKQLCIVNCTQQVTAFTVNLNGAVAAYGAPTSLAADDFFTLKYDVNANSWYRIG